MAVTETNAFGYISAGCVDGDIIYQARESLKNKRSLDLVYGEGSPFKDIALPCGGTIHISIIPEPDRANLAQAVAQSKNRQIAALKLDNHKLEYAPKISLRIVGRGAPFEALAQQARMSGFLLHGQSPDPALNLEFLDRFDHLKDPGQTHNCHTDPWSAVVFLFHDHEWEPALLRQALDGEHFYIGAMGSARTHKLRLETLETMGVTGTARIKGPIGLIPAMRDANRLAISILADIIDTAQKAGRLS